MRHCLDVGGVSAVPRAKYQYFLNTVPEMSLCYGPGLLTDQQAELTSRFMIQARWASGQWINQYGICCDVLALGFLGLILDFLLYSSSVYSYMQSYSFLVSPSCAAWLQHASIDYLQKVPVDSRRSDDLSFLEIRLDSKRSPASFCCRNQSGENRKSGRDEWVVQIQYVFASWH